MCIRDRREVLALSAREVAEMLDMTTAGVNSALQRARATLAAAGAEVESVAGPDQIEREVVGAWVAAFEAAYVGALAKLVSRDVVLEMPPMWNWYRGADAYRAFMARVFRTRGTTWRMVPVAANRQAASAAYRADAHGAFVLHTLQVLTVEGGRITRTTVFQDPHVFGLFDLPIELPR